MGKKEVHAILQGWDAVRDLREIVAPECLLRLEIERRVVRRNGVDKSGAQPVPEHGLIAAVAQGRRHDVLGSLEIRALRVCPVEQEVLD